MSITGNTHEAEDVVQEVMEKVWKSAEQTMETVQNWEAWCMTLTRNRSLDKNRSRTLRRTENVEDVLPQRQTHEANPAQSLESEDMVHQIRKMMQDLPEKHRMVMHLRDIEELSYEEIAETLELSLDQVKVCLHRARKAIRERITGLETAKSQNIEL